MNYNLRIAVVTETYPPEVNGVARTIAELVRGALDRGDSVELIRPRQKADLANDMGQLGAENNPRFRLSIVPGMPLPGYAGLQFGLPVRSRLMDRWKLERPDVVHVVTEGPLGWAAVSAADALGIPAVSDFHTNFHRYSQHYGAGLFATLIRNYLRHLHNRTRTTLVPTRALADELRADGYRRVQVVARGVDGRQFRPEQRRKELRRSWGLHDADLAVIHVGRLAAEKNIAVVMHAFSAIRVCHPRARLIFVGDGPMRQQLARTHPECLFAGVRHGDDLAAHYASADLFLFPSETETFGNVVVESLASGVPVLAYRCAAAAELIQSYRNGLLVEPGDENAFVRGAIGLASQLRIDTTRERYRQNARLSIETLRWESVHKRMNEVLHQVVDQKMPRLVTDVSGVVPRPT